MRTCFICLAVAMVTSAASVSSLAQSDDDGWVRFRGPNGTGLASAEMTAPTRWNADENIKWKVELPGMGSSCPILLGDRIYLTSYTEYGTDKTEPGDVSQLKRHLICLDRADGREVWRATVDSDHDEDPYEGFIQEHGYASSTPVTDGHHIFTFFGKTGILAFDLDGNEVWRQNVGTQTDPDKWGGGSSCILVDNVLVVNAGNEGRAIVGLDKSNGAELWRVEDEGFVNSWCTPCVVEINGRSEVVFSMPDKILAIDANTGDQLWHAKSPVSNTTCPSLALGDGVVFAMGGRGGQGIAIRCGGDGDVSDTHVVWQSALAGGIGTPIYVDKRLYWNSRGIVFCANAETGELIYRERLQSAALPEEEAEGERRRPAGDYASPIAVGENIYLTSRNGIVFVIQISDQFTQVADNHFAGDDSLFNATPAAADGELYFRSDKALYCIAE